MNVVLDTNVLVSALWSPGRKPWEIVGAVIAGRLRLCYDFRIVEEYERVLRYPKFGFQEAEIAALLEGVLHRGLSVIATPIGEAPFSDETDRKFYEVARYCGVPLITGNIAHFPKDGTVITVAEFWERYLHHPPADS